MGTAIAASTGLSVGYVIWLIRSGMLLSSVLSSMPAWRLADPLVILSGRGEEDDDDESLITIIDKGANNTGDRNKAPYPSPDHKKNRQPR